MADFTKLARVPGPGGLVIETGVVTFDTGTAEINTTFRRVNCVQTQMSGTAFGTGKVSVTNVPVGGYFNPTNKKVILQNSDSEDENIYFYLIAGE